jgi:hypothetical protein
MDNVFSDFSSNSWTSFGTRHNAIFCAVYSTGHIGNNPQNRYGAADQKIRTFFFKPGLPMTCCVLQFKIVAPTSCVKASSSLLFERYTIHIIYYSTRYIKSEYSSQMYKTKSRFVINKKKYAPPSPIKMSEVAPTTHQDHHGGLHHPSKHGEGLSNVPAWIEMEVYRC